MAKRTTANAGDGDGSAKRAAGAARPARGEAPAPRSAPVDGELLRTKQIIERRRFREKDVSIARMVNELGRQAKRDIDRVGAVAEAWRAAMPAELLESTWIESSSPVQILVGVESSPAAYAVDRALRAGALDALRKALHAPGLRVRTRIGRSPAQ